MFLELDLHILAYLLVDHCLFRAQFNHLLITNLIRKVIQHLLLSPAKDERKGPVLEFLLDDVIPRGLDVLIHELLPWAQHSRVDELEQVPHLSQMILQRCSGKDHLRFTCKRHCST